MLSKVIFTFLLAAASCQYSQDDGNLDSIFDQIFGIPAGIPREQAVSNRADTVENYFSEFVSGLTEIEKLNTAPEPSTYVHGVEPSKFAPKPSTYVPGLETPGAKYAPENPTYAPWLETRKIAPKQSTHVADLETRKPAPEQSTYVADLETRKPVPELSTYVPGLETRKPTYESPTIMPGLDTRKPEPELIPPVSSPETFKLATKPSTIVLGLETRKPATEPSTIVPGLDPITNVPGLETHKPEPITNVPALETHKPESITNVPALETHKPEPITNVPGLETHKPEPITNVPALETHKPEPITNVPALETHKPEPITNVPALETHKPESITNVPALETHKPESITNVPGLETRNPEGPEDLPCTTPDGQPGQCVPSYLCNADNTIITDGVGNLNIRSQNKQHTTEKTLLEEKQRVSRRIKRANISRDGDEPCPLSNHRCCLLPDTSKPLTPPEPKREGCGWRNPNGVGTLTTGDVDGFTKFGEFPWTAAIFKVEPVEENEPDGQTVNVYVGGGTLIHPGAVLTTAHIVSSQKMRVRAGEWDTMSKNEPYPYQDRQVASAEVHQDFNKGNLFYDIAVLFISQPFDLAPNVGVVCLPPPRERVPAGTKCFATGWGKSQSGKEGRIQTILKKVELPAVDREPCQVALRKTRLGRFFNLHSSFMCAGGIHGKDTCEGDGGSPLSCPIETEDGRYMQSGMVAWGIGCGEDGTPGVYVDVSNLREWVDDKIAGKGYDPKTYSF